MKKITLNACLSSMILILSGCHSDSDSNQVDQSQYIGVFKGTTQDENRAVLGVQIVLESEQKPLLTLSDDRNHLTTYSGQYEDDEMIEFKSAQFSCSVTETQVVCETPSDEFELSSTILEQSAIDDYQGSYQALWNDVVFEMNVSSEGVIAIKGSNCESNGQLIESSEISNLMTMDIIHDDCGLNALHAVTQHSIENDSLYSLDVLTSQQDFPLTWVASISK